IGEVLARVRVDAGLRREGIHRERDGLVGGGGASGPARSAAGPDRTRATRTRAGAAGARIARAAGARIARAAGARIARATGARIARAAGPRCTRATRRFVFTSLDAAVHVLRLAVAALEARRSLAAAGAACRRRVARLRVLRVSAAD